MKTRPHKKTLTGVITPLEWDDNDRITAVGLKTANNEEYLIESGRFAEQLAENVHDLVDATGTVSEADDGEMLLRLDSFRVHDDPAYGDNWGDDVPRKDAAYDDQWLAND